MRLVFDKASLLDYVKENFPQLTALALNDTVENSFNSKTLTKIAEVHNEYVKNFKYNGDGWYYPISEDDEILWDELGETDYLEVFKKANLTATEILIATTIYSITVRMTYDMLDAIFTYTVEGDRLYVNFKYN